MVTIKEIAAQCGITRQGIDRRIKSLRITPKYITPKMRIITVDDAERLKSFACGVGRPKKVK